jgi:hypothetical protein
MRILDKLKLLDFMSKRKAVLYDQATRDFGGGLAGRSYEHSEVKYWKEAIERGEFDSDVREVYIILSLDRPELADFTFYIDRDEVSNKVNELNKISQKSKYWYVTLYSNSRNERDEENGKSTSDNTGTISKECVTV